MNIAIGLLFVISISGLWWCLREIKKAAPPVEEELLVWFDVGKPIQVEPDGESITIDWKQEGDEAFARMIAAPGTNPVQDARAQHQSRCAASDCGSIYVEATDEKGEIIVRSWSSSVHTRKDIHLMTSAPELHAGAERQGRVFVCDIIAPWQAWVLEHVLRAKLLRW